MSNNIAPDGDRIDRPTTSPVSISQDTLDAFDQAWNNTRAQLTVASQKYQSAEEYAASLNSWANVVKQIVDLGVMAVQSRLTPNAAPVANQPNVRQNILNTVVAIARGNNPQTAVADLLSQFGGH